MEDLRAYTPEEIILSNLSELAGRQSAYREQLQAHLRELADEISPDTCRFWDAKTGEKLDKDRFRRDMGGVEDAYREMMKRVFG